MEASPRFPLRRAAATLQGVFLLITAIVLAEPPPPAPLPPVSKVTIEVGSDGLRHLRDSPRTSITARVRVNDRELPGARIHLKGATGSFRPVDDRPSLTVTFDAPGHRGRLHLENSVEDPGLLQYWLGSELFREAGLPVPRVSHARVELEGRALGLYLLREGYDSAFLQAALGTHEGILYEPAPGSDVDGTLDPKSSPSAPVAAQGTAALAGLTSALAEPDPARRGSRLGEILDISAVATVIAGEVLLEHRDGYALARNNYRVLWRSTDGRLLLLPHGMDQLFVGANFPKHPHMAGTLARVLLETPEGRRQYDDAWQRLSREWWKPGAWEERIRNKRAELEPHLTRAESKALRKESEDLLQRIQRRGAQIQSP